jgi:hypothetical protein
MRDGSQEDLPARDVMLLSPGHDAWAVGDRAYTFAEFSKGNDDYTWGSALPGAQAGAAAPS